MCRPSSSVSAHSPSDVVYDLVVYGGTSSAVIAAVQAKRLGLSVALVSPDKHLGGLSSSGLGWTDSGDKSVIGGLSREFYHRVWQHYQREEAWRWQPLTAFGNKGQDTPAIDPEARAMWVFEPHVAEEIFEKLLLENSVPVFRQEWLDRVHGVDKHGARITAITALSGRKFAARMFIDATYEGDLMAAAGVSYVVGREARSVYRETYNGVQTGVLYHRHHFGVLHEGVSPYVIPGNARSGVLPHVSSEPPGNFGAGDHRVQAYCFRLCLTHAPGNRVPFIRPDGYDANEFELMRRIYAKGWRETFHKFDSLPNGKADVNNHGPMSFDYLGASYDYPEASYERRTEIVAEHRRYQQSWLYFVSGDPCVPIEVREEMQRWGLAADEFTDNQNWPPQLYIREARRMLGEYVMTENELLGRRPVPDSIGMGSYTIDSHNVQRYITPDGFVQNEGDIGVNTSGPYEIAYGAITPRKTDCENLLVSVCASASHIAYGSIRMEPVFMVLGHSASTAAHQALREGCAVQDISRPRLAARLLADSQVLSTPAIDPRGDRMISSQQSAV